MLSRLTTSKKKSKSRFRNILSKATFIAKNVIYIKSFTQKINNNISKSKSIFIDYPLKPKVNFWVDKINVKIVKGRDPLIKEAQKLRFQNFFEENNNSNKVDSDMFDNICDHLVVIDTNISENFVVGTYRLLLTEDFSTNYKMYTETEFNLSNLKKGNRKILEVGRSCVHPNYRDGRIIRLLWRGLASYISQTKADYIIGCASFNEVNPQKIKNELSFLHHFHKAPKEITATAIESKAAIWDMVKIEKINVRSVFKSLPPLIKAYLRVGSWIGDGAVVDEEFKTIDVCIILETKKILAKYINMASKN